DAEATHQSITGAAFRQQVGEEMMTAHVGWKKVAGFRERQAAGNRPAIAQPVTVVGKSHLPARRDEQAADTLLLVPDNKWLAHRFCAPRGWANRSTPARRAMSRARPSRAVSFPRSSSETKRVPTPAMSASSACVRPWALRAARICWPRSAGVRMGCVGAPDVIVDALNITVR